MATAMPPIKDVSKSEYLSQVSHEIRTPLTSIIGYAEVMLSDPMLSQEAKLEYVEIIRNAGLRLSEFLDSYIESEVVERNKKLDETRRADVSLISQQALEKVAALAATKSIRFKIQCEPAIFLETSAPEHIVHILENLLLNAIDLAPDGGHIDLIVEQLPAVLEMKVINKDRGFLSLSESAAGKSFRWVQSPGIEIHQDGLGLAFAKHVVELEGGLLNIQCLEQGLTFKLQFPQENKP